MANSLSKNEILTNLYALRAGLSLIYSEKERLDDLKERTQRKINENKLSCKNFSSSIEEKIESENNDFLDCRKKQYETRAEKIEKTVTAKRILKELLLNFWHLIYLLIVLACGAVALYAVSLILGIALFIISLVILAPIFFIFNGRSAIEAFAFSVAKYVAYPFITAHSLGLPENWVMVVVPICIFLVIIGIGVLLAFVFWKVKDDWLDDFLLATSHIFKFKKYKKLARSLQVQEDNYKTLADGHLQKYNDLVKNKEQIIKSFCDPLDDESKKLTEAFELEREQVFSTVSPLYNKLSETFSPFLHSGDWKNIDYLIFLFETGRADDLKESLQLLDNENRFLELKQTISQTGTTLCNMLKNGLTELNQNIQNGINKINDTIIKSTEITVLSNKLLSTKLDSVQSSLGSLISAQSIQNALLQQSSVNSNR
ncbi:MAG: hypothetical protein IJ301_05010, partial [Clostridia bacterium]|nr:hypothetical protein [Clostridia bacterium]